MFAGLTSGLASGTHFVSTNVKREIHHHLWIYPSTTLLRGNTHVCCSSKPAVIGSRLFSFKRNTTLLCGVRDYPSQVVTNSSSDITLLPVSGVLSGVLFTQVSTINYFIFLVICGPGLRNVILKNQYQLFPI